MSTTNQDLAARVNAALAAAGLRTYEWKDGAYGYAIVMADFVYPDMFNRMEVSHACRALKVAGFEISDTEDQFGRALIWVK